MLSKSRRVRVVYDLDEIDHFFLIDGDFDYYLVPVAAVGGMHAITLADYEHFRVPRDPAPVRAELSAPAPSSATP
jgi:hypothetical protein